MPGTKKYFYRRKSKAKPKTVDARQTKEIKALKRKVATITKDIEDKFIISTVNTGTTFNQLNPVYILLNPLAQGTGSYARIGSKCKFTHIELGVQLYMTATNNTRELNMCRVLLVREKPAQGTIFSPVSFWNTTVPYTYTLFEKDQRTFDERFVVHYDKTVLIDPVKQFTHNIKINRKLNFITEYNRNNTGTITDIDINALYLLIITDQVTANFIAYRYDLSLRFEDP